MVLKTSAKKSFDKNKKLITIEIKKEFIDKHEKGIPPPPPLHRLPRAQIFKVIKLIKSIYIIHFTFSLTVLGKYSFP